MHAYLLEFRLAGAFIVTLAISTIITFATKTVLSRRHIVREAQTDRWHKVPVPLFGGIAMFVAFTTGALVFAHWDRSLLILLGLAAVMFATGFIDDIFKIRPTSKLIAQMVSASMVVICGYSMMFTDHAPINMAISLFLIICLTNAFNLLDNMDGLSAGVALIVVLIRGMFFGADGDMEGLIVCLAMAGAITGFLLYNFSPASIFMGDCGSLFLGFTISSLFVISSSTHESSFSKNLLWTALLAIPMIDTFFVSITRKIGGRKISQGGRDHLSHRLVKAGLSERCAVGLLWAFAAAVGLVAFYLYLTREFAISFFFAAIVALFSILLGRYLAKPEKGLGAPLESGTMHIVKVFYGVKYKRYVLQMVIDTVCIISAWYLAYVLRFGTISDGSALMGHLAFSIFVVTPSVLMFLGFSGVYRGTWSYIGISDVVNICKGILLGSISAIFFLSFVFQFHAVSRGVVFINVFILMVLLPGTRASYKLFNEMLFRFRDQSNLKKVLIYGAGDKGVELVRSIRDRQSQESVSIVGFIDDAPGTQLNSIMGKKVLGTVNDLLKILETIEINEILISTSQIPEEKVQLALKFASLKQGVKVFKQEYHMVKSELIPASFGERKKTSSAEIITFPKRKQAAEVVAG